MNREDPEQSDRRSVGRPLCGQWASEPARPEEAPLLAALLAEGGASRWGVTAVEAELAHPDARVWRVFDERPIGVLFARRIADELQIFNLAVASARRRRGVASALLARAIEDARRAGDAALLLEVGAHNAQARAFYAARGFVVAGRRPRYYPGGEDAVLMTCAL